MERSLTTPQVADLAGASYRQIDYWCRLRVLSPENNLAGSGGHGYRRWTEDEVAVVAVIVEMSNLGATTEVWRSVASFLSIPPSLWPDRILVGVDGAVSIDLAGSGWLLDLASIRDRVAARLGVLVDS